MDALFLILLFLAFALFGGLDRPSRWHLWDSGWFGYHDYTDGWGWSRHRKPMKTDWEIRQQYKKSQTEEVITVSATDKIDNPDPELDKLIALNNFNAARKYRSEMEKIAVELSDDDCMRKYAIYGARISKAEKEFKERKRHFKPITEIEKSPVTRPFVSETREPQTLVSGLPGDLKPAVPNPLASGTQTPSLDSNEIIEIDTDDYKELIDI